MAHIPSREYLNSVPPFQLAAEIVLGIMFGILCFGTGPNKFNLRTISLYTAITSSGIVFLGWIIKYFRHG
jgi:hypothetical protein